MEESLVSADHASATASRASAPDAPPARSRGERMFDWGVYGGLAGVGAFVATVPLAYYLKYGGGQRIHQGIAKGFEKIAPFIPWKTGPKFPENAAMTTSLMQGGNAMLIPIGILEKHKIDIVDGLNRATGDATPREQIEKAPKQTWGSLIKSRLVAWLSVFTVFTVAGKYFGKTFDMFEHETGELACKIMRKPITCNVAGALKETRTYLYGKIGALDVFATIGAALILYIGGHFFARKQEEKQERRAARKHGDAPVGREDAPVLAEPVQAAVEPERRVSGGGRQHEGTAVVTPSMALDAVR